MANRNLTRRQRLILTLFQQGWEAWAITTDSLAWITHPDFPLGPQTRVRVSTLLALTDCGLLEMTEPNDACWRLAKPKTQTRVEMREVEIKIERLSFVATGEV